jgi:hypothetical protein
MKKIIMAMLVISISAGLYAQTAFFATKAGMELTYAEKNAKGNATAYTKMTIKNVQGSGSNMTISYIVEILDKNRKSLKPPHEVPLTVIVRNNVVTLDMKGMFASVFKDESIKVDITGTPQEIPNNLQPGQKLKDSETTMTIDMGFTKMSTVTKTTGGICEAIEDIKVAAGTFKCHKMSQTVSSTAMGKTTTMKIISWYAVGIGTVKTETYNDKNKLQSSSELVELKGN